MWLTLLLFQEAFKSNARKKGADMDHTLALILALLPLSVCVVLPGAREAVNVEKMKSKVTWMAQRLVVRMDRHFPVTRLLFHLRS